MRRWIALAATALLTPTLVTTAPAAAQTTSTDPAGALEQQLRSGLGVQVTETNRVSFRDGTATGRSRGKEQGGPSGPEGDVAGREILSRLFGQGESATQRRIAFGRAGAKRPATGGSRTRVGAGGKQILNVLEPGTLRFLVREAEQNLPGAHGVRYRGVITWADLYRVSPGFREMWASRPEGDAGRTKISWRLWIDDSGLPTRLATETSVGVGREGRIAKFTADTRYTGWESLAATASPAEKLFDGEDTEPRNPADTVIHGASER